MTERPKVGVAVMIRLKPEKHIENENYLMGKRKNAHGDGTWCFPGGHLEFSEGIAECGRRETREEAGIEIKNVEQFTYTNDIFKDEGLHYVTLYLKAEYESGDVKIMEPDKCTEWRWVKRDEIKKLDLFIPMGNFLKQLGLD